MEAEVAVDVGLNEVHILVWLVRIAWLMTHAGGKGKLGDAVKSSSGFVARAIRETNDHVLIRLRYGHRRIKV